MTGPAEHVFDGTIGRLNGSSPQLSSKGMTA